MPSPFAEEIPRQRPGITSPTTDEVERLTRLLAQAEDARIQAEQEERLLREQAEREECAEKRKYDLEIAKLQLQIAEANARAAAAQASNPIPQAPAYIQITQREDKVADFKKEAVAKKLKIAFNLEGSSNYDLWRDEALT
jgi:hypothetical protein